MQAAHSILPPSAAKAWKLCAMWPTMNRLYPKPDTPESLEGTAAHWVAWEIYAGRPVSEGMSAPNGQIVTLEMIEGGELLCEVIRKRSPLGAHIERPIACARVHDQCWGTPDAWDYQPPVRVLEIFDYKFGHRFVDEYENDQCVTYAAGILDELAKLYGNDRPGLFDQDVTVNITIVQPRCFYKGLPVRTWSVKAVDLRAHINQLRMAAEASFLPNPKATTNSECINCPGRHACAATQLAGYSDAEFSTTSPPVILDPAAASLELRIVERAIERLKARQEGLQELCFSYARKGERLPFHAVEQTVGRVEWAIPAAQAVAIGQMFGVDIAKPGVMTPKQAISAGIDETVITAYSKPKPGSMKLNPVNPADARRVFGITYQES